MGRETDALAELLRALKDRSGRSYGALGKRLHVSTSTLHRYCNGTAVPTEYAPLERFARVCGASAEELVELHRRWILADASRRRDGGRPGGDPSVADAVSTGRSAEGATRRPEASGAGAEAGAEAQAGAEAEAGAEADAGAGETAPDLKTAPAPAALRTSRTARLRRPRLLIAAGAVAVAAVAVPALVTAAQDSGRPSARSVADPTADGTADGSAARVPHGGRATTADSAPTGSTSPTGSPSRAVGRADSAGSSRNPSHPATAPASAPFHVNVLTNNWDNSCDQWFLLNSDPKKVAPPPASQATDGWAAALGAVPAGHLRLQVTVQGDSSRPVVLHGLHVRVTGTRKAPAWNAFTMGGQCGGDLAPASFAVDLDAQAPSAKAVPGHEGNIKTRATDFPYKVSADDPEVLNIDAATAAQDVDWYLELVWSSGDRQGTTRIDDHGRPFRTAGMRGDKQYWYNAADGKGVWQPWTG
ncbi:helix-turn-helix domain-containing protein [Streptomyces sp. NPDC053069]|uniref:helix-turn-helix domain-containing protein n=1 Tax=Streptomyces sp. NPDC053069 TaxID=3365695 RepID=UPI0037D82B94